MSSDPNRHPSDINLLRQMIEALRAVSQSLCGVRIAANQPLLDDAWHKYHVSAVAAQELIWRHGQHIQNLVAKYTAARPDDWTVGLIRKVRVDPSDIYDIDEKPELLEERVELLLDVLRFESIGEASTPRSEHVSQTEHFQKFLSGTLVRPAILQLLHVSNSPLVGWQAVTNRIPWPAGVERPPERTVRRNGAEMKRRGLLTADGRHNAAIAITVLGKSVIAAYLTPAGCG